MRELDIGLRFDRRVGSSLDSDSRGGIGAPDTYSSENVSVAVIEKTSSTTPQENIAAKWKHYATTEYLKYVVVHWKEV